MKFNNNKKRLDVLLESLRLFDFLKKCLIKHLTYSIQLTDVTPKLCVGHIC